jgi:hypothetical protein
VIARNEPARNYNGNTPEFVENGMKKYVSQDIKFVFSKT